MAAIGKYPEVYPEIIDLSQIVENASTSVIAAVGEARKGSIFKRKYITSAGAMENTFGKPDLKYGYLGHCMTCAMSDASEAYVVRVCSEDSRYAGVKIPSEENSFETFVDGYSLKEVENCEDESFFYKYQIDKDGHYVLDDNGERILLSDPDGNPLVDENTLMTIVGENPNMDDIRVRMEETTVIPSNKKVSAGLVKLDSEETLNSNGERETTYFATINTGKESHGLEKGDKVIISNCALSAFNGTFDVVSIGTKGTESYQVQENTAGSLQSYYVAGAPGVKVSKVFSEDLTKSRYVESPATNYCYKFKTVTVSKEGLTSSAAFEDTVYVHASRAEEQTYNSTWFIPVISADSTVPGIFFVEVDNSTSSLVGGENVFATPDELEEPVGTYSAQEYNDLNLGPRRFMKANVPYSTKTDISVDSEGNIATSGVFDTSSYEGNENSVFFAYFGKYKFVKEGSKIFLDADLKTFATDSDLVDKGLSIDGALTAEVDAEYNVVLKQYVPFETLLYTDSTLMKKYIRAESGSYIYVSEQPIVSETNSFRYQLKEKPTATDDDTISGLTLRWVKAPGNDSRKFDVFVYEYVDGVLNLLESFNDCTIYSGVDGYGVQTKITSKINDKSSYIKVVLNDSLIREGLLPFPKMTSVLTGELTGGSTDEAVTSYDVCKGWDLFSEYDQVSVNLLMEGGYANEEENSVKSKMLEIAEKRRDCFCVFDVPITCTESGVDQKVEDYRKNSLGVDSYRAALYTPWVKVYDTFTGTKNVMLPPSGFACGVIARTDRERGVWVAPAGMNNGPIACAALTPIGLTQEYTTSEQGSIYSSGINYIRKTSGMYLIWGQKTLQFKASAMDRINVTRMVIYIETSLREASKWHLFEQNTAYKRAQITMQFEAWLDSLKSSGGLYDYKVVCDDTNNTPEIIMNNQMWVDVFIQPEYAAEFIKLNTILQRRDATIGVVG